MRAVGSKIDALVPT